MQSTPEPTCCPDERWKPVENFAGVFTEYYEVSTCGRVRSFDRRCTRISRWGTPQSWIQRGRLMKLGDNNSGRLTITFVRDDHKERIAVHRLVIQEFVGEIPSDKVVCHNDGNFYNNHLSNLRIDTQSENLKDAVRHGTNYWKSKTHCPHGHPYDEANTIYWPSMPGVRRCRACNEVKKAREREKNIRKKMERAQVQDVA